MEWEIGYYNETVQKDILSLPAGIQARYIHLTQRILLVGPNLGMPHSSPLGDGLFELRMKSKEGIGRVMYCTLSGKRVVMLHSFIKKTQKTPARELKIAGKRMKEVLNSDDA